MKPSILSCLINPAGAAVFFVSVNQNWLTLQGFRRSFLLVLFDNFILWFCWCTNVPKAGNDGSWWICLDLYVHYYLLQYRSMENGKWAKWLSCTNGIKSLWVCSFRHSGMWVILLKGVVLLSSVLVSLVLRYLGGAGLGPHIVFS